jgi:hypothetical protein
MTGQKQFVFSITARIVPYKQSESLDGKTHIQMQEKQFKPIYDYKIVMISVSLGIIKFYTHYFTYGKSQYHRFVEVETGTFKNN